MKLFCAPEPVPDELLDHSLFLAGGIGANAPVFNWQAELVARLDDSEWTLLNPRRDEYPAHDSNALREQIGWEHRYLRAASAISFWFPAETLCPITLYELGAWSHWRDLDGQAKPLVVGAHPDYAKRADIVIQLAWERPEIEICFSLAELEARIRALG